jgi:serine/arginine repetitive matrix protein 2
MYNGIGLTTPRGSGTSGHVVKNSSFLRPEFFRNKIDENTGKHNNSSSQALHSAVGNKEILDHNKKREIESKLYELQETMIEQGYGDAEIEEKLAEARKKTQKNGMGTSSRGSKSSNDSHVRGSLKNEENVRIRSAFGINSDFSEGDSFNEAKIESDKKERIAACEAREKKRADDRRANERSDDDNSRKTEDRSRRDYGGRDDRDRRSRRDSSRERGRRSRSRSNGRDSRRRTRS